MTPSLILCGKRFLLAQPLLMGVVNVTPDSFSDGGRYLDADCAIRHAARLVEEGADLLDIGAESSRPGAQALPVEEEKRRLLPVLTSCSGFGVPLSVDTYKPEIMRLAAQHGVAMLNDIWAFRQPGAQLAALEAARSGTVLAIMHMRRDPANMQDRPEYADVVTQVHDFLARRVAELQDHGVALAQMVVDPGFGFGKTVAHNLRLLRDLRAFATIGVPIMAGLSRKSTIGAITDRATPDQRVHGSVAAALIAAQNGATILRVHDVAATRDALRVWAAVNGSQPADDS